MSETMIAAFIGAGATLLVTLIAQITTVWISRYINMLEIKQKEYQTKRENLNEVYKTLVSVVNLFPDTSPNDILNCVEYGPYYSMEDFDSTLKTLEYQIEDYKEQLDIPNLNYNERHDIEAQILNRVYSKKKISEVRDKYYEARDKYKSFCESEKVIFDLYAGQDVRNSLVEFEVVIHNAFISGYSVGEAEDPINNIIRTYRRKLINNMREDIGMI